MKRILTLLLFWSIIPSSPLFAQDLGQNEDFVVVQSTSVYIDYCLSNDLKLLWAEEHGIPIVNTTLIINGVIIMDKHTIDLVRNTIHGKRLGPYHIIKIRHYSRDELLKKRSGIAVISDFGAVEIVLRKCEVFDAFALE